MPWREIGFYDFEDRDQPAWDVDGSARPLAFESGEGGIPSPGQGTFGVLTIQPDGNPNNAGSYYHRDNLPVPGGATLRVSADIFAWSVGWIGVAYYDANHGYINVDNGDRYDGGQRWMHIERTITLPANARFVRAMFGAVQLGGEPMTWGGVDNLTIEVWDADVITGIKPVNLLPNGGFRYGLGAASGWTPSPVYPYQMFGYETTWALQDGDEEPGGVTGGSTAYCCPNRPNPPSSEFPLLESIKVPIIPGRTYTTRGLVAQHRMTDGNGRPWLVTRTWAVDGTTMRRDWNSGDTYPTIGEGGQWLSGWSECGTTFVAQPGEAFVNISFAIKTPDAPGAATDWYAWFDQGGIYEGDHAPVWENQGNLDTAPLAYPGVDINGLPYTHLVRSAAWALGRSWWFAGPEPGLATIELYGDREEIRPGMRVKLYGAKHPPYSEGGLFTGMVDDVTMDETIENGRIVQRTRVTVADQMSWCARASTTDAMALPVQTFEGRIFNLANLAGLQGRVQIATMPAATMPGYCLELQVRADERHNILDLIDAEERYANTILQMDGDGRWRAMKRCAQGTFVSVPFALEGDSCPSAAHLDRQSTDKAINRWTFSDGTEAWPSAVEMFGAAEYAIPYTRNQASYRYPGSMREKVAIPVFGWTLTIPIRSRAAGFTKLGPFDYVLWRGKQYQVMNIAYNATPGSWQAVVGLGPTQGYISGGSLGDEVAPPPEIPPEAPPPEIPEPELPPEWFPPEEQPPGDTTPNPPAPTRKRATVNAACTKDAYVALTAGGLNAGNGAGSVVLVGRLTDGTLCRGLFGFAAMSFLGSNRTVVSATLTLTTRRGSCMSWGSSPHVKISRMTSSWSEGSYNASSGCGFAEANAVKWPGGTATSAGQVTKAHSASDGIKVSARIDEIAQAWLSGQPQYGVRLSGYNDDNSANRSAFAADSTATLQVVYDYDE
jgi:hypothetical protein